MDKPRILGLTASPLINVKKSTAASEERLQLLMTQLESKLDAKIVGFSPTSTSLQNRHHDGTETRKTEGHHQEVEEHLVHYDSSTFSFSPFPSHDGDDSVSHNEINYNKKSLGLHRSRIKELNQLKYLYEELGPLVTGEYCIKLAKELSRSRFEGESAQEYKRMIQRLHFLSEFCLRQCRDDEDYDENGVCGMNKEDERNNNSNGGRTNKLVELEELLGKILTNDVDEIEDGNMGLHPSERVGLIFVERRITAIALYNYFKSKHSGEQARNVKLPGKNNPGDNDNNGGKIKCDMLVRQSHQIFKYLHIIHKMGNNNLAEYGEESKQLEQEWLHHTKKIRSVLDRLRRGETNLLVATSIVEEGVDVAACSFVIVFDGIKTSKGYVQMKGRARQKNATFFCFHDINPSSQSPPVALEDAQEVERAVTDFLERREEVCKPSTPKVRRSLTISSAFSEENALQAGEYCTDVARVDLRSAKSVLNQYFLAIPMDQRARSSRKTLLMQLPIYSEYTLTLPSHLPPDVRHVSLPDRYCVAKKKTEEKLALMALVRLHKLKLLNENLLPLKRKDLLNVVYQKVLPQLPSALPLSRGILPPTLNDREPTRVYLYPLLQSGIYFDQHEKALKGRGRHLGLLSTASFSTHAFTLDHSELGSVSCQVGQKSEKILMDGQEWLQCAQFYSVLINARWRRRTGRKYFSYKDDGGSFSDVVQPYVVVSLTENGCLDWARMRKVVAEYSRTEHERASAASSVNEPRLWSPKYDPNVTYVAFSKSALTCDASFPDKNEEIDTYRDYFLKRRSFNVSPSCPLFNVQRLWTLPRKFHHYVCQQGEKVLSCTESEHKRRKTQDTNVQEADDSLCVGLMHVYLPQEACTEAPMADASLFLHCVLLPQILYHLDRCLTAQNLISHCLRRGLKLGEYLKRIELDLVVESITANSCAQENYSYDRLEYLGDAVLKVIHTDALLHSPILKRWVACLHEGDLSTLRSAMGCNDRLKDAAKSAGIDKFILLVPLARGLWIPKGLHSEILDQNGNVSTESGTFSPSMKVCADVVEALVGLVYLHFGFAAAEEICMCLGITLPRSQGQQVSSDYNVEALRPELQQVAESFLGIEKFKNSALLKEALTHASFVNTDVPSYQKMEWVGDAVLTLAVREWAYRKYSELSVSLLVVAEATIVCNETLSYLAWRKGLQCIIQHCDPSLPGRIENFALGMRPEELGLWGTDPPKILADTVEALLGAVHTELGFSRGQNASLFVLSPMMDAISEKITIENGIVSANSGAMMHPKQQLFQLANFLKVRMMREHEFATKFCKPKPIWRNGKWKKASLHGDSIVCHVSCFGIDIIALSGPFSSVAQNRACAVATEILSRHPDLMNKIQVLASNLTRDE